MGRIKTFEHDSARKWFRGNRKCIKNYEINIGISHLKKYTTIGIQIQTAFILRRRKLLVEYVERVPLYLHPP